MGLFRKSKKKSDSQKLGAKDASILFMQAALMLPDTWKPGDEARSGRVLAFAFGAFDAIAQRQGLNQIETLAGFGVLVHEMFAFEPERAGEVAAKTAFSSNTAPFDSYAQAGGQAVLDWFVKSDKDAPMRLVWMLSDESEHATHES